MTDFDRPPRIAVAGGSVADAATLRLAEEVGHRIARVGAILLNGGLSGVMEASARGAVEAGGLTIGFLPGDDAGDANPWVRVPLPTGLGEARNVLVVRGADAVIAIAGGWGTLSEIALARRIGAPVVLLRPTLAATLGSLPVAADPAEAVELALAKARERRAS